VYTLLAALLAKTEFEEAIVFKMHHRHKSLVFFKWTKRERKKKNPALLVASHRWNETKKSLNVSKKNLNKK
jgi:hypothetical protein